MNSFLFISVAFALVSLVQSAAIPLGLPSNTSILTTSAEPCCNSCCNPCEQPAPVYQTTTTTTTTPAPCVHRCVEEPICANPCEEVPPCLAVQPAVTGDVVGAPILAFVPTIKKFMGLPNAAGPAGTALVGKAATVAAMNGVVTGGSALSQLIAAGLAFPVTFTMSKVSAVAGALPPLMAAKGALIGKAISLPIQFTAAKTSALANGVSGFVVAVPIAIKSAAVAGITGLVGAGKTAVAVAGTGLATKIPVIAAIPAAIPSLISTATASAAIPSISLPAIPINVAVTSCQTSCGHSNEEGNPKDYVAHSSVASPSIPAPGPNGIDMATSSPTAGTTLAPVIPVSAPISPKEDTYVAHPSVKSPSIPAPGPNEIDKTTSSTTGVNDIVDTSFSRV